MVSPTKNLSFDQILPSHQSIPKHCHLVHSIFQFTRYSPYQKKKLRAKGYKRIETLNPQYYRTKRNVPLTKLLNDTITDDIIASLCQSGETNVRRSEITGVRQENAATKCNVVTLEKSEKGFVSSNSKHFPLPKLEPSNLKPTTIVEEVNSRLALDASIKDITSHSVGKDLEVNECEYESAQLQQGPEKSISECEKTLEEHNETQEFAKKVEVEVGDLVMINGNATVPGIVQCVGNTHFAKGIWIGIRIPESIGLNDGSIGEHRYFTAPRKCGVFAPPERVTILRTAIDIRRQEEEYSEEEDPDIEEDDGGPDIEEEEEGPDKEEEEEGPDIEEEEEGPDIEEEEEGPDIEEEEEGPDKQEEEEEGPDIKEEEGPDIEDKEEGPDIEEAEERPDIEEEDEGSDIEEEEEEEGPDIEEEEGPDIEEEEERPDIEEEEEEGPDKQEEEEEGPNKQEEEEEGPDIEEKEKEGPDIESAQETGKESESKTHTILVEEEANNFLQTKHFIQDDEGHSPQQAMKPEAKINVEIDIGDLVIINGNTKVPGLVQYVGYTHFAKGIWIGIRIPDSIGLNDGSIGEHRYFTAPCKCGVFAPPERVTVLKTVKDIKREEKEKNCEEEKYCEDKGENDLCQEILKCQCSHHLTYPKQNRRPNWKMKRFRRLMN